MTHIQIQFLLLVLSFMIQYSEGDITEISTFCHENGLKLISIQEPFKINRKFQLMKALFKNGSMVTSQEDQEATEIYFDDSCNNETFEKILNRRILKSILVTKQSNLDCLEQFLQQSKKSSSFYLALEQIQNSPLKWFHFLTLQNSSQVVKNQVTFDDFGRIKKIHNLQGLQIIATALSWPPSIIVEDCNRFGRACKTKHGFLVDLMNIWSAQLNFTWDIYKDVNNDWGEKPKSGHFDKTANWTGVFGDVVTGRYHLSLTEWIWFPIRDPILDFVPITKDRFVLAIDPRPPSVDFTLFLRPFRAESWNAIMLILVLVSLILLGSHYLSQKVENDSSRKITVFFSWFFFVLINAFYGGALTMFFTSEPTLPFTNLQQVLKALPDWTLVHMKGNDALFQVPADQVHHP